jgi:adenosine deaminase
MIDFATFLRRVPKVDLHCHLVGALRATTLADLARKHRIALPRPAETLYDFKDFYVFIDTLRLAATVMRDGDDFARVAYEAMAEGNRAGNLRHVELMFNPQYFLPAGVSYRTMVDGLCAGVRAASADFGMTGLLIACLDRQIDPTAGLEIMQMVVDERRDEIVGIGLDGPERAGPPQRFVAVYELAVKAGLRRTAHVCEDNQTLTEAPPQHYAICVDQLHCERLDHGYNLLSDAAMTDRARRDGLFFTTCPVTSARHNLARRRASIGRMVELGLQVTINTDDPTMFGTDIGHSYGLLFDEFDWRAAEARQFSLAGVEASWLDDAVKRRLRGEFAQTLDELERQLAPAA